MNCFCIQGSATSEKDRDLLEAIIDNVVPRCGCDLRPDRITDRVFQCFPSSPQTITYHAQLHGTLQANVSQLLTALREWALSVETVAVQFLPLSVESFCAVASSSPLEECPNDETTGSLTPSTLLPSVVIAVSGSAAVAITLCVIIIAALVIVALFRRKLNLRNGPM